MKLAAFPTRISFEIEFHLEFLKKYLTISASKSRRMRNYIEIPKEFRSEKQPPLSIGHSEDNGREINQTQQVNFEVS